MSSSYEHTDDPLSKRQVIGILVAVSISLNLSFSGSASILLYLLRHSKWREGVYFRLMLGLSMGDLVTTIQASSASLSFPSEIGLWMTFGNKSSCMVSAFFSVFLMTVVVYSFALSANYLAKVALKWKDRTVRRWIEIPAHVLAWSIPTVLSSAFLLLDGFVPNVASRFCTIGVWPNGCTLDDTVECQYGEHALNVVLQNIYIIGIFLLSLLSIINTVIVACVATQELKTPRYAYVENENGGQRTRALRKQAVFYCAGNTNTFLWATLYATIFQGHIDNPGAPGSYSFLLLFAFFYPLQGAINAAVFLRPRVERMRQKHPDKSVHWAIRQVVVHGESATATTTRASGQGSSTAAFLFRSSRNHHEHGVFSSAGRRRSSLLRAVLKGRLKQNDNDNDDSQTDPNDESDPSGQDHDGAQPSMQQKQTGDGNDLEAELQPTEATNQDDSESNQQDPFRPYFLRQPSSGLLTEQPRCSKLEIWEPKQLFQDEDCGQ